MLQSAASSTDLASAMMELWRLAPLVDLHLRHWNDEWTVFDGGSGQTHLIDTLTAMALMVMEGSAASRSDIEEHVARTFDLTDASDMSSRLDEIIVSLCQLGLVEPAPP